MTYAEATGRANLARAGSTSHEIATGVNYTVGLPPNGGDDDYYVIAIPAFR